MAGVVCKVVSLVMVPMRMDIRVRRVRGGTMFLASLCNLVLVCEGPVRISRIICML